MTNFLPNAVDNRKSLKTLKKHFCIVKPKLHRREQKLCRLCVPPVVVSFKQSALEEMGSESSNRQDCSINVNH